MTPRPLTTWLGPIGLAVLLAIARIPTWAQTPPAPNGGPPPALKTLGADDAKRVEALQATIERLRREGKFTEAQKLAGEILIIGEKALGADHWQTADARREIETLKTIAALPDEGRKQMASIGAMNDERIALDQKTHYAQAERVARELVAIHKRWLGPDHPDTANSINNLAINLNAQKRYGDAEPLVRRALADYQKALGPDHPATAIVLHNLAYNLHVQEKHGEAEPLVRQELAAREKALGPDHRLTTISLYNLAINLNAQGKYGEAEPLYRRALAAFQSALGPGDPLFAQSLNSLAVNLNDQAKYGEAEPLLRRALAARQRAQGPEHPETAHSLNSLAVNLDDQGKYGEAEPLLRRALAARQKAVGPDDPLTANILNNLAYNLDKQGRYGEAEPLNRMALAARQNALGHNHSLTAESLNNLAFNLNVQGKYGEAELLTRRALATYQTALGRDHPATANSLHNLACNLQAQGKHGDAEPLYRRALAAFQKALGPDHPATAQTLINLASDLDAQNRLDESVAVLLQSANTFQNTRRLGSAIGLERAIRTNANPLPMLALGLVRQGRPAEAWTSWEANLGRGLLDALSARLLRPLSDDERRRESTLIGQLQRLDEQVGRLVGKPNRTQDEDRRLDELRGHWSDVRGAFVALQNELDARYQADKPLTLAEVQAALPVDTALVGWVDLTPKVVPATSPYHWACVVRSRGEPIWVKVAGSGPNGSSMTDDDGRWASLRAAMITESRSDWRDLAAALARHRIEPLRPHLNGVARLVILPSPTLVGIPVEALVECQPPDAPRWLVSYAPSGSMFARLTQNRTGAGEPARFLALGDPAYPLPEPNPAPPPPPDHGIALLAVVPFGLADLAGLKADDVLLRYNGTDLRSASDLKTVPAEAGARRIPVRYWRRGEERATEVAAGKLGVEIDQKRTAAQVLLAHRAAEETLKPLTRGESWDRLPGTRREVETIASLLPSDRVTTLLGAQATETAFQRLARSGELKRYRFIHLATHGKTNPDVAMSAALFLAPDPDRFADPAATETDGRITAQQIVNTWDLDADLVVLSACESGLGRYAGGEGYLGFTQALFVKGARSVVLSLWDVDDEATSLLMRRFYENLLGKRAGLTKPLPKVEALADAKAWLRRLDVSGVEHALAAAGLTRGSERPVRPGRAANPRRPFEHPYYWASFLLVGDPN
jgi:tetratricopeptide (TPR) repeat protein